MVVALTTMRTRWDREATAAGTAESHEVDFNIAQGQAIEIFGISARMLSGAITAGLQTSEALVDLDGPALASNAIATQAVYEAREILESCIANFGTGSDALTSGGAEMMVVQNISFEIPIITARNLGTAFLSIVGSGEMLIGIRYRIVRLTQSEEFALFASGRA